MLSSDERTKLLVDWNDTQRDYPVDRTVDQLFDDQVEKTPEAVATIFNGQALSFRELQSRANFLAHRLRGLGI